MCYYQLLKFSCGDYKWGRFKTHCKKDYRISETCGTKQMMESTLLPESCKCCAKIETKCCRVVKERHRIERWRVEGNRCTGLESAYEYMNGLEREIFELHIQRTSIRHLVDARLPETSSFSNVVEEGPRGSNADRKTVVEGYIKLAYKTAVLKQEIRKLDEFKVEMTDLLYFLRDEIYAANCVMLTEEHADMEMKEEMGFMK